MSESSPVRAAGAPRRALRAFTVLAVLAAPAALAAPAQALDYGGGGSDRTVTSRYPTDFALLSARYATTTQRASTVASISTPCGRRTVTSAATAAPQGRIAYAKTTRGVKVEVDVTIAGATGQGVVRATGKVRGKSCARKHGVRIAAPSAATGDAAPGALRYGVLDRRDAKGRPLAFATLARGGGRQSAVWESRNACSPKSASGITILRSRPYAPAATLNVRDAYVFGGGVRGGGTNRLRATITPTTGVLRGTVRESFRVTGGAKKVRCDTGSQKFTAAPVG